MNQFFKYRVVTQHKCFSTDNVKGITEMRYWLRDNVDRPYVEWTTGMGLDTKICVDFKYEKDAVMFSLICL